MIPYSAEELIAIAEKEYAFSLSEIRKAAREMGFRENWKAAMEKVKDSYVEAGTQPELIRTLARQAEEFFDALDRLPRGRGTGADVGRDLPAYRRLRHQGHDTHFDVAGRAPDQVDLEGLLQERRQSTDVSGFGIVLGSD